MTLMNKDLVLNALNWRYATKIFDPTKKLSGEILDTLLEPLRLSPSSLGVQPWKFLVVENPELRKRIREAGHDQPQFTEASHLIILCRREDVNEKYIDEHVSEVARIRNVTPDSMSGYKKMVMSFLSKLTPIAYEIWTSKQVYIALGFLLTACAVLEVDACPMEGFDAPKVDEILGLKEKNLRSTVSCALGYRSANDKNAFLAKSRFPSNKVIEFIK